MIDKGGARRGDSAHDVVCGADHQRGDAAGFDHVSDETDGLMTEGSVRHKQREIDLGGKQASQRSPAPIRFQFFCARVRRP